MEKGLTLTVLTEYIEHIQNIPYQRRIFVKEVTKLLQPTNEYGVIVTLVCSTYRLSQTTFSQNQENNPTNPIVLADVDIGKVTFTLETCNLNDLRNDSVFYTDALNQMPSFRKENWSC